MEPVRYKPEDQGANLPGNSVVNGTLWVMVQTRSTVD
jgi:hypothetical protein